MRGFYFSLSLFFSLILSFNKFEEKIRRTSRGIPAGRLFRFIREFSSRRYFPRVHVPIPIGGVVNTVWPGIYPCYLIVSFHSNASSYTTGLYSNPNSHPLFSSSSLYRRLSLASCHERYKSSIVFQQFRLNPLFPTTCSNIYPEIVGKLYYISTIL